LLLLFGPWWLFFLTLLPLCVVILSIHFFLYIRNKKDKLEATIMDNVKVIIGVIGAIAGIFFGMALYVMT